MSVKVHGNIAHFSWDARDPACERNNVRCPFCSCLHVWVDGPPDSCRRCGADFEWGSRGEDAGDEPIDPSNPSPAVLRAEAHLHKVSDELMTERCKSLEDALRSLIDMETNRYACASERNAAYAKAKELLDRPYK